MSSFYSHNFSPSSSHSPQIRSTPEIDRQYLAELLAENQKLEPFTQVLPLCNRLLNQEILRVSLMVPNHGFQDYDQPQYRSPSPMASSNFLPNIAGNSIGSWGELHQERFPFQHGEVVDWPGAPPSPRTTIVKKILRLEIRVESYPNFNFVGRLLGPRGNSLKRVEASTGCRVYIRGQGSIRDPVKEEKLRGKPGYEHLDDPLHILIEAELHADVVDTQLRRAQEIIEEILQPVKDESQDHYKRHQLRELAMLNSSSKRGGQS